MRKSVTGRWAQSFPEFDKTSLTHSPVVSSFFIAILSTKNRCTMAVQHYAITSCETLMQQPWPKAKF